MVSPLSRLHSGTSPTAADAPDGLGGGTASAVLQKRNLIAPRPAVKSSFLLAVQKIPS